MRLSFIFLLDVAQYNPSLFKNIEIMVARIPTFCIGAYLGHFVKERKVFGSSAWLCVMIASAVYSIYAVLALHRVEHSYWWWRVTMIPGGVIGSLLVCGMFSLLDGICFVKPIMAFFRMTGGFSLELYVAHIMCFWSRGLIPPHRRQCCDRSCPQLFIVGNCVSG